MPRAGGAPLAEFSGRRSLEREMRTIGRFLGFAFATGAIVFVIAAGVLAAVVFKYEQELPDYTQLKNYEPPVTTRVH